MVGGQAEGRAVEHRKMALAQHSQPVARRHNTGHRGAKEWPIPAWAGTNPSPACGAAAARRRARFGGQ